MVYNYVTPLVGYIPRVFQLLITILLFAGEYINVEAADISASYNFKQVKFGGTGWITGIIGHPSTPNLVYGRTDVGGCYKWDENSQTWTQLFTFGAVQNATSNDYPTESIAVSKTNDQILYAARQQSERLAVDPNNESVVYYGTRVDGLQQTTDGGQTWTQVPGTASWAPYKSGDPVPAGIKVVVFDPTSTVSGGRTQRIYAGVAGMGLFGSTDGGVTWNNLYAVTLTDVIVSADVGSDGLLYFTTLSKLISYNPRTNAFTDISPKGNPGFLTISVDPFNPQRLISVTSPVTSGHMWRSTNGGASWDIIDASITSSEIGWVTFSDERNWLSVGNVIWDGTVKDRLWFGQGVGVWRTDKTNDMSLVWEFVSKGIEESVAVDVIAPPGGSVLTAIWDRKGAVNVKGPDTYPVSIHVNEKFSSGWDLDYSGQNPNFIVGVFSDHRFLNPDYSGYSQDFGKTWTIFAGKSTADDRFAGNIAVSAVDTSRIVRLPTFNRAPYYSTDMGATWNQIQFFSNANNLHGAYYFGARKALASDLVDGSFYIYGSDGLFFASPDGINWAKTPASPSSGGDSFVYGIVVCAPGHAGHVWVSGTQGGLSYTFDKGQTFVKVANVTQSNHIGFGKKMAGGTYPTIYLDGTVNGVSGLFRSADAGLTFDYITTFPKSLFDNIQVVNGDMNVEGRVYVGFSGNGFVYADVNGVDITPPSTSQYTLTPTTTTSSISPSSKTADTITTSSFTTTTVSIQTSLQITTSLLTSARPSENTSAISSTQTTPWTATTTNNFISQNPTQVSSTYRAIPYPPQSTSRKVRGCDCSKCFVQLGQAA
ncbi:hypothetical protein HDU76_004277 [Blyttiomyces sp. JEL0837]|nr:hypothetical protein HDU76_004277 [Blyttiomyces sp. JEL0837]